uniref:Uncharacterized protein n=1 Tax=Apis mellifera TaxID=7460 RepID=D3XL62_APIME|nr:hypothetical protein [Apis mellifera]
MLISVALAAAEEDKKTVEKRGQYGWAMVVKGCTVENWTTGK